MSAREPKQNPSAATQGQLFRRVATNETRIERPDDSIVEQGRRRPTPKGYRSWHAPRQPGYRPTRQIAAGMPQARFRSLTLSELAPTKESSELQSPRRPRSWRWLRDQALFIIEIAALIGVVALIIAGMLQMQLANTAPAEALEAATPTPEVLPGASTPPTAEPFPRLYRQLIRRATPVVLPTPSIYSPTRIVIRKIGVDAPIVEGDSWEQLKKGVGHHIGSGVPGARGNMVLSAHVDAYGKPFRYLHTLEAGDVIEIYAGQAKYNYIVKGKRIVEATEVSVMAPTTEPTATLITCYPYGIDTHRLVVFAELAP